MSFYIVRVRWIFISYRSDVIDLFLNKSAQGLAPATVASIKAVISSIFQLACEEELLESNPAVRLGKFIRKKDKRTRKASLTKEQASQFLDVIKKEFPKYYAFFPCAFRTGMRLGELLKTLSLNRNSDVSLSITNRKPFDILAERPKIEESRGNCHSFEPLLNAFLEILINNNTELQLVQELAKKHA